MERSPTSSARRAHIGARPGGRSERVRAAIVAAAIAELVEVGYAGMTMSSVAKRAGVALTTVHRRWESKATLAAEVIVEFTADAIPAPDTGSLEDDLRSVAESVAHVLGDPGNRTLLRSMFALPEREAQIVRGPMWGARAVIANGIIRRAIDRGEIPDQEQPWRLVELLSSMIWMRVLVIGAPVDERTIDLVVADVMAAARGGGPA